MNRVVKRAGQGKGWMAMLSLVALMGWVTEPVAQTSSIKVKPTSSGQPSKPVPVRPAPAKRNTAPAAALPAAAAAAMVNGPSALPPELARAWAATRLPDSALSVVVAELNGPSMVSINAQQPRNPASVMKLVTTWAALEGLGPSYTWNTELLTARNALPRPDGVLPGPLYIRAGGDPNIRLEDVWAMMRELRVRGVRVVPEIVIDRSRFGPVTIDPGEFDNAPDRVYNASPDALMIGFGALRLIYTPDPATRSWQVQTDPPLPGVRVENQIRWSTANCPGSPVVQTEPRATQDGVVLKVSGTVAGNCGEFTQYRLALTQPDHTARVLRLMWEQLGGTLAGPIRAGNVPPGSVVLATHVSPQLSEVIRPINKYSNNVMTRQLLLGLGAEYVNAPATQETGLQAVREIFAARGVSMPELVLDNGAGLSRNGRVSAASMANLLQAAWRSPLMPEFISSMAVSGLDGTVRRRLRDDKARGLAHVKTGSLRDVSAIAGYVQGVSGKRYLMVSLVNHEQAASARAFDDALIAWLAAR